ncbi:MAG: NfeD family protein [Verrucomicrobia bacterium]|jgi:membrane-bound serine protease (ClpP class)|nr:NfeD family protein [Verrucomicrobiota bacterium]MBT7066916.1 NfeD family protein [Verrucomicrobiota bacterium]MBT7699118.1 NfeD family protein [Verrucomicrobiota bacterium]
MNTASAVQLFFVLLGSGLLLLGAEVFVPGGVLGIFGGLLLLGAMVAGYPAFPGSGHFVAVGILFLAGVAIALWIRFFPRSRVGKAMTVSNDESDFSAVQDGLQELLGAQGEAKSDLRPAGFALINGHRIDVVTQGGMIDKGTPVTVVEIEANRVVVKRTET